MDRLLQKENLDLKLTPYKVLATSAKHGLVAIALFLSFLTLTNGWFILRFAQFIESKSVAQVLADESSIQNYFRKLKPNESKPYGIEQDIMENYVKVNK